MAQRTQLIVPSAINMITMANAAILESRKAGFDAQLTLPSLRRRARLIVQETALVPVKIEAVVQPTAFTR